METKLVDIKFLMTGITCTGCAMDMENILLDMDGVEDASINFKDGIFSITYDSDQIEEKTIVKKVENLGFESKLLIE
jgi:copper chaperone CopZ